MKRNGEKYEFEVPQSLKEAHERLGDLTIGVMNVEKQLGDRRRAARMEEDEYETWRERTKSAKIYMVAEQRFLKDWIKDRRYHLLAKQAAIWPENDPRTMLRRAVQEGRKCLRGERHALIHVLDTIDLYLTHSA